MYQSIQNFIQSIESDNPLDDVSHHMDQYIALYHLIGGRSDIDVCANTVNGKFGFSLLIETEESTKHIAALLHNNHFSIFNKKLNTFSEKCEDNCVQIYFA